MTVQAAEAEGPRAVIAGTGRAGTSFLVRWLAACGVPAGELGELAYNDRARAGLERHVRSPDGPYLVKDPWLHEYLHTLDGQIIDALIIPVRDLRRAALSRLRQERTAIVADMRGGSLRRTTGHVAGGGVYSLSVNDLERVLAVGQAKVIEWALSQQIPLYLLHYPRLAQDAEYAIDALSPWLLTFCDRERALRCFAETSSPSSWLTDVGTDGDDHEEDPELVVDLRLEIEALHIALDEERVRTQATAAALIERATALDNELAAVRRSRSYRLTSGLARVTRRAVR